MISERGYASLLAFVHSLRGESLILHRTVPTKNMGLFYRLFPGRELSAPARRGRCLPAPTVNSIRLAHNRESGDASSMGDMLKLIWWAVIGLLRSMASLEAEILTLRHQLNIAAKKTADTTRLQQFRSTGFCWPQLDCAARCECLGDRRAGDPLASCWFSFVLTMEVATSRWQTEGAARNSPTDPRHEPGQPAVGRSTDWRTPRKLAYEHHSFAYIR
jgi:hypothetical protein